MPSIPAAHGEAVVDPPMSEWLSVAEQTAARSSGWSASIAGVTLSALRRRARREAVAAARSESERLGLPIPQVFADPSLIAMTGHQPELFHPGVWAKHFAMQRFADATGALPIDLVVDTDRFDAVTARVPCARDSLRACEVTLVRGTEAACYACAPVPSAAEVDRFIEEMLGCLSSLQTVAPRLHVAKFATALHDARARAANLAEMLVCARRIYEAPAQTDYLELPVSVHSRSEGFARFTAHLLAHAERFALTFNEELRAYRRRTRTRSASHPFPELAIDRSIVEVPFWALVDGRRKSLYMDAASGVLRVEGGGSVDVGTDPEGVATRLLAAELTIAPKAVALTMFERVFVADLFIHGVGGARYDAVTDAVIARWLGIEPPPYAVVSLTLHLPVGARMVTDEEVARARQRLRRVVHNPDEALKEVRFDTAEERVKVERLVAEKSRLVASLSEPEADRRDLTRRIESVNTELRAMVAPVIRELEQELRALEAQVDAEAVLTDRRFSFPLWDPVEVADKVR